MHYIHHKPSNQMILFFLLNNIYIHWLPVKYFWCKTFCLYIIIIKRKKARQTGIKGFQNINDLKQFVGGQYPFQMLQITITLTDVISHSINYIYCELYINKVFQGIETSL